MAYSFEPWDERLGSHKAEKPAMDQDAAAEMRRFPGRIRAINDLIVRNEGFREMCADFATAEAELEKWRTSADPRRDRLIDDYSVLVDELAMEITTTLDAAGMVSFPRR